MLCPAIAYKYDITNKFMEYYYSDEMMNYTGCFYSSVPQIEEENNDSMYQYAIVDGNKVVGYFAYQVNWYARSAYNFGLFAFDKNNRLIGIDVYRELRKLINEYQIHRIEWRMVGGNPVEKHYDRFCQKYNGKKFTLTDAIKDRRGMFHDDIIYEIVFKECGDAKMDEKNKQGEENEN